MHIYTLTSVVIFDNLSKKAIHVSSDTLKDPARAIDGRTRPPVGRLHAQQGLTRKASDGLLSCVLT